VLIAFFEARRGQLYGFRWKDWSDFKSCAPSGRPGFGDQQIAVADGLTRAFQLTKTYASGGHGYVRPIAKPVEGTVLVGISTDEQVLGVDFELELDLGILRFAEPPDAGEVITAGFEFDVPVRFDTDTIQTSVASFQAGEVPNVPVVEIRL
jgi:uncharacterized protein (TIGR02217 family)